MINLKCANCFNEEKISKEIRLAKLIDEMTGKSTRVVDFVGNIGENNNVDFVAELRNGVSITFEQTNGSDFCCSVDYPNGDFFDASESEWENSEELSDLITDGKIGEALEQIYQFASFNREEE